MNVSARKLTVKLNDPALAALLVGAGFDNPRKIRDASDKDLKAIPDLGQASLEKVRERFPKG